MRNKNKKFEDKDKKITEENRKLQTENENLKKEIEDLRKTVRNEYIRSGLFCHFCEPVLNELKNEKKGFQNSNQNVNLKQWT